MTHSGPEVFFKTCVAMKFVVVDDDDDIIDACREIFNCFSAESINTSRRWNFWRELACHK